MKAIKGCFLSLLTMVFFISCNTDDNQATFQDANLSFVRFSVQLNSDGTISEFPNTPNNPDEISQYELFGFRAKLPVKLSQIPNENVVNVSFDIEDTQLTEGVDFTIQPSNKILNFQANQLTDTITVALRSINEVENFMRLRLVDVSNPNITLGYPRNAVRLDAFELNIKPTELEYSLENNLVDNSNLQDEEIVININFSNGFFENDIVGLQLLEEVPNENTNAATINYNLEQLPINTATNTVSYKYTVNQTLENELLYETTFQLNNIASYIINGDSKIIIRKPVETPRDNSVNTAAKFYDLSNPFYRTFGENWMDFNSDGTCSWQAFNAFTYPVVVAANHPNAVLFDDLGTTDPSDDIYHHAFRIGFNSPNIGNTTNSFNLKRWFNNESISAANSPGFNIIQALEFFPENGTSTTNGLVQVVNQSITIAGTNGNSYSIAISGDGTYQEISNGIFEIDLKLEATNQSLFNGTRISKYKIYNTNSFDDPLDLSEACFEPISL